MFRRERWRTTAPSTSGRSSVRRPRTLCRTTPLPRCLGPARMSSARWCCGWPVRTTSAPGAGSPTSTTGTSAAARCSPSRRTPGWSGCPTTPRSAWRWPATATPGSPHSTHIVGARLALAEAYRNVAASGARPIAVTDCLNFGSPEDPGVMWQFQQVVHGLADGCAELGIPVTGGNVSFYNQTGSAAILPTPVVGVLGVIDDVSRRLSPKLGSSGDHVAVPVGRDARRTRRLGVGAGGARASRRATAGRRPGRRTPTRRGHPGRGGTGAGVSDARSLRGRAGPGPGRDVPDRERRRAR